MQTSVTTQRNGAIDVLRLVGCVLIICLHYAKYDFCVYDSPQYHVFFYLRALTTIGVPIFLLITGYYLPLIIEKKRLGSQLKKLVILALISSALYMMIRMVWYYHKFGDDFLKEIFNAKALKEFLISNVPMSGGYHLWYLYAVIYNLIIIYFMDRLVGFRKFVYFIVAAFLILVCATFGGMIIPWDIPSLVSTLPLLCTGALIRYCEDKCRRPSILIDIALYATLIVALVLLGVEAYSRPHYIIDGYASTYVLSILLIIIALRINMISPNSIISKTGRDHSTNIFILQVAVGDIVFLAFPKIFFHPLYAPLSIFILCLAISWCILLVKNYICKSRRSNTLKQK